MNSSGVRDAARALDIYLNTAHSYLPKQVAQHAVPRAEVVICCEAEEKWSFVRSKAINAGYSVLMSASESGFLLTSLAPQNA